MSTCFPQVARHCMTCLIKRRHVMQQHGNEELLLHNSKLQ